MSKSKFINRLHLLGAILFVLGEIFSGQAVAQNNDLAQELLAHMAKAVRQLNYRGKFTYEVANSALETYALSHRVVNGREVERLERLNSNEKIVVRDSAHSDCLTTGDKILRGGMGKLHPSDQLFSNYSLYLRGEERIAGRHAYLVQLIPHDQYRNGHLIAIDKQSFLPLQKQWFSPNNKLMERVQFVDLELLSEAREDVDTDAGTGFSADSFNCNVDELVRSSWAVNWLPTGFFLTKVGRTDAGESMLAYTDGLASFSVFIKEQPVEIALRGSTDRGATLAYVGNRRWQQNPFRIIVIGEIPLITAQKVVESLEPLVQ